MFSFPKFLFPDCLIAEGKMFLIQIYIVFNSKKKNCHSISFAVIRKSKISRMISQLESWNYRTAFNETNILLICFVVGFFCGLTFEYLLQIISLTSYSIWVHDPGHYHSKLHRAGFGATPSSFGQDAYVWAFGECYTILLFFKVNRFFYTLLLDWASLIPHWWYLSL